MNKSYLTAIYRRSISTPARYLKDNGLLIGRVLDYGCGRGKDVDELGLEGYDPHYFPEKPKGKFDTIMCNFVLNVIPDPDKRQEVINKISGLLKPKGIAYISVRNDKSKLNGYTSRGTWQGFIELDLPIIKKTSSFVLYILT